VLRCLIRRHPAFVRVLATAPQTVTVPAENR
jgi:hypothetical protein